MRWALAGLRAPLGVSGPGCALAHALVLRRLRKHPSLLPAAIRAEDPPCFGTHQVCPGKRSPQQPRGSELLKAREAFWQQGGAGHFGDVPSPSRRMDAGGFLTRGSSLCLRTAGGEALGVVASELGEPRKALGLLGCSPELRPVGGFGGFGGFIAGETEASTKAVHTVWDFSWHPHNPHFSTDGWGVGVPRAGHCCPRMGSVCPGIVPGLLARALRR